MISNVVIQLLQKRTPAVAHLSGCCTEGGGHGKLHALEKQANQHLHLQLPEHCTLGQRVWPKDRAVIHAALDDALQRGHGSEPSTKGWKEAGNNGQMQANGLNVIGWLPLQPVWSETVTRSSQLQ